MKSISKIIALRYEKILILILFVFGYSSCDNPNTITLSKLEGSPSYLNAKISTASITLVDDNEYAFSFDINNYQLGEQTVNKIESQLANSGKGQHIHFIVNNGPYSAHYTNNFKKKLNSDNNVILAFLSRSYHESVKNPNAFILTQIGESKIDLDNEFLFLQQTKRNLQRKRYRKITFRFLPH